MFYYPHNDASMTMTFGLNRKTKSEQILKKIVESSWRRRLKHGTVYQPSSLSRSIIAILYATTACPVIRRAERAITGGER